MPKQTPNAIYATDTNRDATSHPKSNPNANANANASAGRWQIFDNCNSQFHNQSQSQSPKAKAKAKEAKLPQKVPQTKFNLNARTHTQLTWGKRSARWPSLSLQASRESTTLSRTMGSAYSPKSKTKSSMTYVREWECG